MGQDTYETPTLLDQYLLFHYGEPEDLAPWPSLPSTALEYPRRCVEQTFTSEALKSGGRALDIGCAVGGSSFTFARHGLEVTAFDYSHAFVEAAETLRHKGSMAYRVQVEGTRFEDRVAQRPAGVDPERLRFLQGDAHQLDFLDGPFDCVLAANLLCRLQEPVRFIDQLKGMVRQGGELVMLTPATWSEEWTPMEAWIGGTPEAGTTAEVLPRLLQADFKLEWEDDLPFLIREHRRKFQHSVAHAFRFRRLS